MSRRTAIDELRAEADRRGRAPVGITRFQIVVYAVIVAGIVLIAYARTTAP